MKRRYLLLAAVLPWAVQAAPLPQDAPTPPAASTAKPAAMSSTHVMLDPSSLQWGAAPPALEKGAQAVVLSGDPAQAGPFTLRLKMPAGFKVALHWHPTDERVTVIEGDATLTMGAGADADSHTFGPGGYAVLPARMHHAASTQGGVIVQIDGMGPFQLNYVDPKDDPRTRAPADGAAGD